MYDITIVGAGPAGSTLAKLLGSKYKILVIEKRNLEYYSKGNNREKCCGGLLAPDAQYMIAKMGLGIPKDILVDPQLFAVRTIDLNNNIERYYQRFYFNMDREKFDRWLVSQIPKEVDLRFNSVFKSFTPIDNGYEIRFSHNKQEYVERTKVLIGADGGNSLIRGQAFSNHLFPKNYISIQEWYETKSEMPYFTAIFDKNITDFYSWIIPKNGYILLGGAFDIGKEANEKFQLLKMKLQKREFQFGKRIKREGAFIYRPTSLKALLHGKDNIALVGEAAGSISPSSAEGFSYALKSALYLAQSLESGIDGFLNRYKNKLRKLKANILLKNLKSPAMYNTFLRRLAMKSGIQSIKVEN
ncbi:oxidoreductase [Thermohalobacter berrensis]|uniref:Oxidoreductase n=2 Tax=Thermohalobacter berrensis TaxID=99594 RepID=A0A419T1C3_9FIRM|nr:oxidoreductase [Thermohalobacter berrensis]